MYRRLRAKARDLLECFDPDHIDDPSPLMHTNLLHARTGETDARHVHEDRVHGHTVDAANDDAEHDVQGAKRDTWGCPGGWAKEIAREAKSLRLDPAVILKEAWAKAWSRAASTLT